MVEPERQTLWRHAAQTKSILEINVHCHSGMLRSYFL